MEKDRLHTQLKEAEMEAKRQKQQLLDLQEKGALNGDVSSGWDLCNHANNTQCTHCVMYGCTPTCRSQRLQMVQGSQGLRSQDCCGREMNSRRNTYPFLSR